MSEYTVTKCIYRNKWVAFLNCVDTFVKPFANRILWLVNQKKQITNAYRKLMINRIFDSKNDYLYTTVNQ